MTRTTLAAALVAIPFLASTRLPPGVDPTSPSSWGPDYEFSHELNAGQTLGITNIDGDVTISRTSGHTAHIIVNKMVRRGNGELVGAILEETANGIRVCTVYRRSRDERRTSCRGNRGSGSHEEPLDVTMTYTVSVPAGVRLDVATVDGDVDGSGIDVAAQLATVDGDVTWRGAMPDRISTVDGDISIEVIGLFDHGAEISSVDGNIVLALPEGAKLDVTATSVDGDVESDFPLTLSGGWGSRRMRASLNGGGPMVRFTTVDGTLRLRRQ